MTKFLGFTPLARSLAIASLTGAALLAGSLGPVMAQTATTPDGKVTPPAAAAATRIAMAHPTVMRFSWPYHPPPDTKV